MVNQAYTWPELRIGGICMTQVTTARNKSVKSRLLRKKPLRSTTNRRIISTAKANVTTVSEISSRCVSCISTFLRPKVSKHTDEIPCLATHGCGPQTLTNETIYNYTNPEPRGLIEISPQAVLLCCDFYIC